MLHSLLKIVSVHNFSRTAKKQYRYYLLQLNCYDHMKSFLPREFR